MENETYLLGHSYSEIQRLIDQARILRPTSERLLRSAGIERGMRVLDLGCGAGDVSMLAAKLVGASGEVVGIDRNAQVLEVARERARAAAFENIFFAEASVDTFDEPMPFNLVIGRYVLPYQVDPVAFLQAAAQFAGRGGILALHEFLPYAAVRCTPQVALWQQTFDLVRAVFRAGAPSLDAAARLIEHFSAAGLPRPALFSETNVGGGGEAPHYAWLAGAVGTLLPKMIQLGIVTAETIEVDTLESRLRSAVVEARSQIEGPPQICAWTRI